MTGGQARIIALVGADGAGRRTIARMLADDFRVPTMCLRDEVRSVLQATDPLVGTQVALSDLVSSAGWDATVSSRIHGGEVSSLLGRLEDGVRMAAGQDVWLRALLRTAAADGEDSPETVCVWDLGRAEDAAWIRDHGGQVWSVSRPSALDPAGLRPILEGGADAAISNSGTRTQLRREVSRLAREFGLRESVRSRPLTAAAPVKGSEVPGVRALRMGAGSWPSLGV